MSFKKFYLILLVILLFVCICNVHAENSDEFVDYHVGFNNSEFSDINSILQINESNKIIYLENGNYSGLNNTNLIISGNTTLIGHDMNKTVFDAKLLSNIFTISNHSNVVLINLTFINGKASYGGAITNHGNLSLVNCSFIQNNGYTTITGSSTCGGAIYNDNTLVINNCYFLENSVGSLFQRNACGGAIYNNASLIVNNSYFKGNSMSFWEIDDENNLGRKGGAIASFSNNTKIYSSVFKNQTTISYKITEYEYNKHLIKSSEGGALFIGGNNNEVLNCLFENNCADIGGAFSILGNNNTVKNSIFLNNSAYIGGALSSFDYYTNNRHLMDYLYNNIYSNISIDNCYFNGNHLMHCDYNVLSLYDNNYFMGGGAVFLKMDNISITNSNFSSNFNNNSRYSFGGAVFTIGANSSVDKCIFNENVASSGGALFTRGISSSIINSIFTNNIALMDEAGAIFHTAGDNFHVINSLFVNNSAKNDGGAVYSVTRLNYDDMEQLTNHFSLYSNVSFVNNSAIYGGAVYDNGDYSTFYNSTFVNNSAMYGGASYNHGLGNSYFNVTFNNNVAKGADYSNGGAIFNYGSLASFNFCEFVDNYADNMGGALYNSGHDVYTSNSTFVNNSAFKGGAVYVRGNGGKIENNVLDLNFAVYGGAIYNEGLDLIISFNNFTSDNANVTGGAVYNTKNNLVLYSNLMDDCHSKLSGFGYGDFIYTTATISYLIVSFVNNQTYTILNNEGYLFANVTDNMGNPVTGGNVTFILYDENNDESIILGISRLWEGVAYVDWNDTYDYGKYIIMGSYGYAGSPVFTKNAFVYSLLSSEMFLTVDHDLDNIYSTDILNYEIVLIDSKDEYIANAEIKIYQSRTYVDSIFTDDVGKVNVSLTNLFGTYKYLFVYNGDLTHSSASETLNFTVKYISHEINFKDVIFVSYYPIVISNVNSIIPFEFSMEYNKTVNDNGTIRHEIEPLGEVSLSYFDLYRDDELLNITDIFAKGHLIDPILQSKKIATSDSGNFILPILEKEPGIHVYRLEFKKSFVHNVYPFNPFRSKSYGYFNAFNSSFIFIVNDENATISTSLDVIGPENITEVDFANYSVNLSDLNGDLLKDKLVKLYDNGVFLEEFMTSNSTVNFTFSDYFDVGEHLIEFVYGGDSSYLSCYEAFFINVFENPNKTSTDFINKTPLTVVGEGNNFTASLVDIDGNPLSDLFIDVVITKGNENISKFNFTTGEYGNFTIPLVYGSGIFNINCIYGGNRFYKNISKIFNVHVKRTPTILFGVPNLEVVGEDYYLNYVLVDDNYTILSNRKIVIDVYSSQFNVTYHAFTNDSGAAKLKITLPVGRYLVLANFEGEKWFDESGIVLTNLTVYGDTSKLIVDSNIIIKNSGYYTVKLTDSNNVPLTGKNVIISVNGVSYTRMTDDNGFARLKINLNYGKYNITSYFRGDLDYKYDFVLSNLFVVDDDYKFPVVIGINKSITFRYSNQKFSSSITDIYNNPLINQTLSCIINGKTLVGISDENGFVLWDFNLGIGSYDAKITFAGTNDYQKNSVDFHITIVSDNATFTVLSAPIYSVFNDKVTNFNVELKDRLNNPISNQIVSISVNGVKYNRSTDENGLASLKINLNTGSYDVYCRFDGSYSYFSSESYSKIVVLNHLNLKLTKINANSSMSIIGKGRYTVLLTDQYNYPVRNANVTIIVNGVSYIRTTNEDGVAGLNINLNPGNYVIHSIFKGNDEYRYSNMVQTSLTVTSPINASNLVKFYKNDSQFYATLTDFENNPLNNVDVSMNINGVFYTRKTNDEGIVRLNINLNPGEYILTVYYPSFENIKSSFNITVLSTLIIDDLYKVYRNQSQYEIKLLNSTGGAVSNTNVSININGVFYHRTTDENGTAILNINLNKGRYIATVCDESNGLLRSSNVVVWNFKPTFSVPDEFSITANTNLFSVNLKDGDDPLVGEPVKFNLNGVNYTQYCDKNGDARIKINLNPGQYLLKSSYANMEELTLLKVN
ncbi:hypothetical protein [Methanobrevibacter sp.]|uniref:hypothetical protein n=1 Tax=Methanobrevibacter sp. TaxID=66852 RepID=UPI00388D8F08